MYLCMLHTCVLTCIMYRYILHMLLCAGRYKKIYYYCSSTSS